MTAVVLVIAGWVFALGLAVGRWWLIVIGLVMMIFVDVAEWVCQHPQG